MPPEAKPLPPIGKRRTRTRTALLDAGQRLFAARAIDSVSIDEIVDAADVAKGSFYNHFDDKEHLASAIVELVQGDSEFHVYAANRSITNPAERMVRALGVMIDYGRQHPDRLQALISLSGRTKVDTPLNAGVAGDIRDGLAAGIFTAVTVETGVLLALGIISMTVTHAIAEGEAAPPGELTCQVGAALLRALGVTALEAARLAEMAAVDLFEEGQSS